MTGSALSSSAAPVIVNPTEGNSVHAFGDTIKFMLTGEQTGNAISIGFCETQPGGGPPPHLHRNEDEMFLILEGRLSIFANDQWTEVGPGSAVYIPRTAVHTFKNNGDTTARFWIITTPSGFENFFGKCSGVFEEAQGGAPDMPRILRICAEHGIEFVPALGPPHG